MGRAALLRFELLLLLCDLGVSFGDCLDLGLSLARCLQPCLGLDKLSVERGDLAAAGGAALLCGLGLAIRVLAGRVIGLGIRRLDPLVSGFDLLVGDVLVCAARPGEDAQAPRTLGMAPRRPARGRARPRCPQAAT